VTRSRSHCAPALRRTARTAGKKCTVSCLAAEVHPQREQVDGDRFDGNGLATVHNPSAEGDSQLRPRVLTQAISAWIYTLSSGDGPP
jgi:hypothetical protein